MSAELAIVKKESTQMIMSEAPQSYQENSMSSSRCVTAGAAILEAIQARGMTDELDREAAAYIEKARKTVKKMNERRAPFTKIFDEIRKEFTALENTIDPLKADTIPFKLQQLRNQFAAKKRAEEETRRRLEYERQQAEALRTKMRQDIKEDFINQLQALTRQTCSSLMEVEEAVTLENYEASLEQIKKYPEALPSDFLDKLHTNIPAPAGITPEEIQSMEEAIKSDLGGQFAGQYLFDVNTAKQSVLDRLPSKKANLERLAKASAEDAARIKAEMEERRRKDAEEQEAALRRKEEEERQRMEMQRKQAEMEGLFNSQAAAQEGYQPKVKVSQKINLLRPEGIMPIISMWWMKEGCTLGVEELMKMFKKQITFCEKLATGSDMYVKDEAVEYVECVKSK